MEPVGFEGEVAGSWDGEERQEEVGEFRESELLGVLAVSLEGGGPGAGGGTGIAAEQGWRGCRVLHGSLDLNSFRGLELVDDTVGFTLAVAVMVVAVAVAVVLVASVGRGVPGVSPSSSLAMGMRSGSRVLCRSRGM